MGIDRDFDTIAKWGKEMDTETLKARLTELDQQKGYEKYTEMRSYLASNGVEITSSGERCIGRCYYSTIYTITTEEELPAGFLSFLREIGLLGYGQECRIDKPIQKDGKWIISCDSRVDSSD